METLKSYFSLITEFITFITFILLFIRPFLYRVRVLYELKRLYKERYPATEIAFVYKQKDFEKFVNRTNEVLNKNPYLITNSKDEYEIYNAINDYILKEYYYKKYEDTLSIINFTLEGQCDFRKNEIQYCNDNVLLFYFDQQINAIKICNTELDKSDLRELEKFMIKAPTKTENYWCHILNMIK